jgi:hypothetical protein
MSGAAIIFLVVLVVLAGIPAYTIGLRRAVSSPGVAFIPLFGPTIVILWSMGRSGWMTLLGIVPLVNLIFGIWFIFALPSSHQRTRWWALGLLVPLIGIYAYAFTLEAVPDQPMRPFA